MFHPVVVAALMFPYPAPGDAPDGVPMPPEATARLGSARFRGFGVWHHRPLLSPDGRTIYATTHNGLAGWDTATGRRLFRTIFDDLQPYFTVSLVGDEVRVRGGKAVDPDKPGQRLLRVLDGRTGRILREVGLPDVIPRGRVSVAGCYSPDGQWSAARVTGEGRDEVVGRVDLEPALGRGEPVATWKCRRDAECVFSPDSRRLAILDSAEVVVIDVATRAVVRRWVPPGRPLYFCFSPDGGKLAVSFWGIQPPKEREEPGDFYVWDLAAPAARLFHRADAKTRVTTHQFTPDGKLVSAYTRGTDLVYLDTDTGKAAKVWANGPWPQYGLFSPDGRVYYFAERNAGVLVPYTFETGKPAPAAPDPVGRVTHLAARPDGSVVGLCGSEAVAWDLKTGRVRGRAEFELPSAGIEGVALSPDGNTALLGFPRRAFQPTLGRTLALADTRTGKVSARWEGVEGRCSRTRWRTPGRGSRSCPRTPRRVSELRGGPSLGFGPPRVWDAVGITGRPSGGFGPPRVLAATGKPAATAAESYGTDMALSADGRYAAARVKSGVHLWDLTGREPARVLPAPKGDYRILVFSPDGRVLAAVGHEYLDGHNGPSRVEVWDVPTGRSLVSHAYRPDTVYPYLGAISPDGRTLAVAGSEPETVLIELATGRVRHRFPGPAHALAFTPDGRHLVTAAGDAPGYVWDVRGALARPAVPADWDVVWTDLIGDDAAAAFRATRVLAAHPGAAVPLLRRQVAARPGLSAERFAAITAGLKSDTFSVRERATAELEQCAELALPGVADLVTNNPSPEVARRAADALRTAGPRVAAEERWVVRAVEAAEWVGTDDAFALIKSWARGPSHAPSTTEAATAVRRLEVSPPAR